MSDAVTNARNELIKRLRRQMGTDAQIVMDALDAYLVARDEAFESAIIAAVDTQMKRGLKIVDGRASNPPSPTGED